MPAVTVSIERFLDEYQPGIVECALTDAFGKRHLIVEKVPVVTKEDIWSSSSYPRAGLVACEVEASWQERDGRSLVRVNTGNPWSVESTEGATIFVVLASQVQQHEPDA
jgi:hypothetical protein